MLNKFAPGVNFPCSFNTSTAVRLVKENLEDAYAT